MNKRLKKKLKKKKKKKRPVILDTVETVTRAKSQASVDEMMPQDSTTVRARSRLMLASMVETMQLLSCDRGSRMAG